MLAYFQLTPDQTLPDLNDLSPYRAIVVIEREVSSDWRHLVSQELCETGCLYMMAWGLDCSAWDDSVDLANLEAYDFKEIPDESFVMTTWRENETLDKVFFFAKYAARHPAIKIKNTVILHIGARDNDEDFKQRYNNA